MQVRWGTLLYEKEETFQIIILCIYILICCYLFRWLTIGIQISPPWKFRLFLIARFSATASGGYNGGLTGHGRKITFQKYFHPKFWGIFSWILANIFTRMLWDNMAWRTLSIFNGFCFIALRVPSILAKTANFGPVRRVKTSLKSVDVFVECWNFIFEEGLVFGCSWVNMELFRSLVTELWWNM